ncbi:hypothetical protein [Acinetobacter sp.]|uniref:hypothetical protein n=1 Tax=Acinetobacter sp. TaxID=472 RepID=UPI002FC5BBE8
MILQQLSLFKEEPFPPDALSSRKLDKNTAQSKISAEDIPKPNLMELINKLESIVVYLKNISK